MSGGARGHVHNQLRYQKLIRIAKQIDMTGIEGVEIGKQSFDVVLRGIAVGRGFDGGKDGRKVGVQAGWKSLQRHFVASP